jgi:hypothetical protein
MPSHDLTANEYNVTTNKLLTGHALFALTLTV